MRTVRTHVQESGGAASAVGVGVGIGVAVAIAFGVWGKAWPERVNHDRRLRLRGRYRFRSRRAVVVVLFSEQYPAGTACE